MMTTSSRITMNAHSGAAVKIHTCPIAFRVTRNTPTQRAHPAPVSSPRR